MILAISGGKGGVGKSTVALNLAASTRGLLVDADLTMADLPSNGGPDLHDVLGEESSPTAAVQQIGGVFAVPCGRSLQGARASDLTSLPGVLKTLATHYDPVIVDCPAGLRADAGLPLYAADAAILVTEPETAAVSDTIRTRELARELGAGLLRVVVNRAPTDFQIDPIRRSLGAPVVTIPQNSTLARAQESGLPVAAIAPNAEPVSVFDRLGDTVQSCSS